MKIAILYICTGNYSIFWKQFYESSEKLFLRNHTKNYFVFTDSENIVSNHKIKKIHRTSLGFPMDSLLRFEMFLSIKEELKLYDFVFFFNANICFVANVDEEVLPNLTQNGLVAVLHPGYYNKKPFWYLYERRKKSSAYISPKHTFYYYYMGSLNGGSTKEYLDLIEVCNQNIQSDLKNGIIAIYHDESHLNRYLINRRILALSPEYAFPENSSIPFKPKILILNKITYGGKCFDKLPKRAYYKRLKLLLRRMINALLWLFGR